MTQVARRLLLRLLAAVLCVSLVASCTTTSAQSSSVRFDREALDAMLAPVALYPDPLLSQVLMAATYPREVDEAAQWSRARPGLTGDAAVRTSEGWDWDPSVRSLLAFPLVLDTMARNMHWTEDLGDAFLAQPEDVMDTVQHLRRRAYNNGTLRSTDYARVIDTGREIVIEPYSPQVAYVPHYDPRIVYGSWWWPSRPPVYWARWPGYVDLPGHSYVVHWGPGIGISSGFFFGGIVWPRREVRVVNVNTYYYPRRVVIERQVEIQRQPRVYAAGPGVWRHDPSRRHGSERREPQLSRSANERPSASAPPSNRTTEVRRDSAQQTPPRAVTAPARRPEPGAAQSVQQRATPPRSEATVNTPQQRRAERQDDAPRMQRSAEQPPTLPGAATTPQRRAERQDDTPKMAPSAEQHRTPPAAAKPQPQRRAERDEPPATNARSRDDGPRVRGAQVRQEAPRGSDRAEQPARQPERERGRAGATPGQGRMPQRAQEADRPG